MTKAVIMAAACGMRAGPACYGHVRAQSVQLIPMVDVSLSKLVAVRKMWPCVV